MAWEKLEKIKAMNKWYAEWKEFTGETFKRSFLSPDMYEAIADEMWAARKLKDYKTFDYLRDKLVETGEFWDFETYENKIIPAYILSSELRRKTNPNRMPATLPSVPKENRLRCSITPDCVKISGVIHEEENFRTTEINISRP